MNLKGRDVMKVLQMHDEDKWDQMATSKWEKRYKEKELD